MSDELQQGPDEDQLEEEVRAELLIDRAPFSRFSPNSIAALVLGLLSLFQVPYNATGIGFLRELSAVELARAVMVAGMPVATGILAVVFASRGTFEIESSAGQYGGTGFCNAGRIAGLVAIAIVVVSFVAALLLTQSTDARFG